MGQRSQTDNLTPASPLRYPVLDGLRILAMLDIVSIHVTGEYVLWGMGLPTFIIVAMALAVRKPDLPTWSDVPAVARKRVVRVLWPWIVWTVFFAANRLLWAWMDPGKTLDGLFYPWMIAGGTSMHLWFLPFIFVAELAVLGILAPLRRVPTPAVIAGALALAVGCVAWTGALYDANAPVYRPLSMKSEDYAERARLYGWVVRKSWLFGTASVCLGVAVGRTLSLSRSTTPRRGLFVGSVLLFAMYFVWDRFETPIHSHAIWQWWRQFFALLCVAAAVQFTGRTPAWLMRIAVLTMGIYLLHGWVGSRLGHALNHLYDVSIWRFIWPLGSLMQNRYGKVAVIWLCTAALVALLRRSRRVRRVM